MLLHAGEHHWPLQHEGCCLNLGGGADVPRVVAEGMGKELAVF